MPTLSSIRRPVLALGFLGAIAAAEPSAAAVFYVGPGCTHTTLSAALAAAAANGPGLDIIRVANPSLVLGNITYDVNNQSVQVVGGFASCAATTPTGRTTITSISTGGHDAFWVHGTSQLILERIDVTMGDGAGRALLMQDSASVVLDDSTFAEGQAQFGGNVRMQGATLLQLLNHSDVTDGDAPTGSGGGIHCENGGSLYVDSDSVVTRNHAEDNGGGIFGFGCTISISGAVVDNIAVGNGGGIYAAGGSTVELFGESPERLAELALNSAEFNGGGLYLVDEGTSAEARNATVYFNFALFAGGAFYVSDGTTLDMDIDSSTCPAGRGCSILRSNASHGGGAIVVDAGGIAAIRQTEIWSNYTLGGSGGTVALVNGVLRLEGCEIFDNSAEDEADRFYVTVSGSLRIAFSTLVEETVEGYGVFKAFPGSTLDLLSSIVQASATFHAPSVASTIDCVITAEVATFPIPGFAVTVVTDPGMIFENTALDYRLKQGSVAQDYCDATVTTPQDRDLDNQTRGFDDPAVANDLGTYDLGADERSPEIFADGFESGNLTRWADVEP